MSKVSVNGVIRDATAEEQAEIDARNTAWANSSASRKLERIKEMRLEKLQSTDWMANSDYTMPDYIKTWRQTLRDLPANNTTESEYDALLAVDSDGYFSNSIWKQPTE